MEPKVEVGSRSGFGGVLVVKAEEESGEEEGEKSRSPVRRARSPMMQ